MPPVTKPTTTQEKGVKYENQTGNSGFIARGCPWHGRSGLRCRCGECGPTSAAAGAGSARAAAARAGWSICAATATAGAPTAGTGWSVRAAATAGAATACTAAACTATAARVLMTVVR
ncbi:hypothetical protein MNVI_45430 [Mycobacterium noviomagense]|uniref:Uncharacterized protein n=1 Tax=Mycobacterium noviomagense TaxID=459858 RepID=A0A7I7PKY5_9MYCO|nr:hypothetical protein BST37_17470 [Mycobacterium noviomagense]BBY09225.1 hypothetical protein MNVI_45430 [Mycobacterium noviomagense]